MPVNFLQLQHQIQSLGKSALAHDEATIHNLSACRALLERHASNLPLLQKTVEEAALLNKGLRCAVPVNEPLTTHQAAVLPAPSCTLLAADGSQINPDPHGSVLFGLVNVGVFRMQPGSGEAPSILTTSTLLYDETLNTPSGLASEELIALLRDVHEREILADLAEKESAPVVTLTDGPLELYHEPRQEASFKSEFRHYLAALDKLALNNSITAGYVDRPRANLVVQMLELLLPKSEPDSSSLTKPFAGISDLQLFEPILSPGERSAVFRLQSISTAAYENKKELFFFYLNVGSNNKPALARVEIPRWVMEDPASLSILQSVLVEQSSQTGSRPYPYPLLRAHEIAVVKMDDREQILQMIENELMKLGFKPAINSNKQSNKQLVPRTRK